MTKKIELNDVEIALNDDNNGVVVFGMTDDNSPVEYHYGTKLTKLQAMKLVAKLSGRAVQADCCLDLDLNFWVLQLQDDKLLRCMYCGEYIHTDGLEGFEVYGKGVCYQCDHEVVHLGKKLKINF